MGKLSAELAQQYEREKTELQKTDKVPYAEILQKKQVYFDYLFETYAHDLFSQDDFRQFFKANRIADFIEKKSFIFSCNSIAISS